MQEKITGRNYKKTYSDTSTNLKYYALIILGALYSGLTKAQFTTNQNFVVTYTARTAGVNLNNSSYDIKDVMTSVQYFDGLARPIQNVLIKGNGDGTKDLVQPKAYDVYGRETFLYLPYTASSGSRGSYRPDALIGVSGYNTSAQFGFYNNSAAPVTGLVSGFNNAPFAQTAFESSPLNRPMEQGAPGASWQIGTNHTITQNYYLNGANDVLLWTLIYGGGATTNGGLHYNANELYKNISTDENGNQTVQYKDKQGHIVCKTAKLDASTYLNTYYVYDDSGNLTYVIPPVPAGENYPTSFSETDDIFKKYIYGYHYDTRNRVVEKKLPGKGWEFLIYNTLDQVVMSQNGVQRTKSPQEWTFTKYDALSRIVMTGKWLFESSNGTTNYDNSERLWLENYYNSTTENKWETRNNSTSTGYDNSSTPGGDSYTFYTINYYDDYDFPGGSSYSSTATDVNTTTLGLLTGTKVRNLVTGAMMLTEHYYDKYDRPREMIAQNNIGGTDRTVNDYNFTGQVVKSTRIHNSSLLTNLIIVNEYVYDNIGRKIRTLQKTGGNDKIVINKLSYNETGQLLSKQLHGTINGNDTTYLQKIDYMYNPRGWFNSSSANLFALQLKYNDADDNAIAQFNGNIGNEYWGTPNNLNKHYSYNYDALNRLKSGISNTGFGEMGPTSQGIEYDYLGNITKLKRTDPVASTVSNYTYNFWGNQLQTVTGLTGSTYHYDENGNADHDGRTNKDITYNYLSLPQTANSGSNTITYTYDATGNKLKRESSTVGIGTTDYDNGIVYDNGVIFARTEEGRVLNLNGSINYEYNLTDHLGNNRVTFDTSQGYARQVQNNDYFPFGLQHSGTTQGSPSNNYLYNDKEFEAELGQYDYGARFYDPVIARWNSFDPLAENGRRWSPYTYGFNNSIRFIDPDGMWGDFYDTDGHHLGTDGKKDKKVYLADAVQKDKKGLVISATNERDVSLNHDKFTTAANVVKHESTGDKTESLWIANAANNAKDNNSIDFRKKNSTVYDQLTDNNYSTTPASARKPLSDDDNSSAANNARAAIISVLTGQKDPTGGAVLWDGTDFLRKGEHQNKFKEYRCIDITAGDLQRFASSNPCTVPEATFGPSLNNNTSYEGNGNDKKNFSLQAVGAQGQSIFWKLGTKK